MLPAFLVTQHPGAALRIQLVDEGHIQLVDGGDDAADDALLGGLRSFGLNLYRLGLPGGDDILPQCTQGFLQFGGGHAAQLLEGIQLQPEKQGLLRQYVHIFGIEDVEGIQEIVVVSIEGAAVVLGPQLVGLFAQMGQQLCIVAGAAELDRIELGNFIEFQEFIVGLDPGIIGKGRDDPGHIAGDPGGTEMPQHADPLVTLLDIEIAQIFKADDGVGDAGLSQVGDAEVDPFQTKFGFRIQQGLEFGIEGGDTAGRLGADDPLDRNFHQSDLLGHGGNICGQDLIQNRRIGGQARHQAFPIYLLTLFQGKQIFFGCSLNHSVLLYTAIALPLYHSEFSQNMQLKFVHSG